MQAPHTVGTPTPSPSFLCPAHIMPRSPLAFPKTVAAVLLQEQLRKSLLTRIADKLEEGGQHPSPTRLASALSPSRSKAQFEDTIPGAAHPSKSTMSTLIHHMQSVAWLSSLLQFTGSACLHALSISQICRDACLWYTKQSLSGLGETATGFSLYWWIHNS